MSQNSYPSYGYAPAPYFNADVPAQSRSFDARPGAQPGIPSLVPGHDARASFTFPGFETSFHGSPSPLDHGLQTLLGGQRPFAPRDPDDAYSNPIANFYNDADGPWNSVRATSQARSSTSAATLTVPVPNLEFHSYREAPASEISDSGYASQAAATQSIVSTEPTDYNRDCADLSLHVNSFSFTNGSNSSLSFDAASFGRSAEEAGNRTLGRPKLQRLQCPRCYEVAKCPSDHKKHMLKHDKPFICDEPGCARRDGFTTVNDLNRHKKSVHKIGGLTKSFRCVADRCKNKDKIWPRLDNFKQHVQRMHPTENLPDMVRRSQCFGNLAAAAPNTPRAEPASHMDNTLAGIDSKSNSLDVSRQSASPDFGIVPEKSEESPDKPIPGGNDGFSDSYQEQKPWNPVQYPAYSEPVRLPPGAGEPRRSRRDPPDAPRLRELADAATATSFSDDQSTLRNGSRSGSASKSQSSKRNSTVEDPQKRFLGQFSSIIASSIHNGTPNESLDKAVLRALLELEENRRIITPATHRRDSNAPGHWDARDAGHMPAGTGSGFGGPDGTEGTITTAEVLAGLANLSKRIRQSAKRPNTLLKSGITCKKCGKILSRNCDMNKHMKRHTRPYGCTFPKCRKVFGSKNDWKRHENSQHFQLETWRCEYQAPSTTSKCAELFYHKNAFENHLRERHRMVQTADIANELKVRRIGRNGQSRFWCGFCQSIIELKKRGLQAWDERFDHIDEHFKAKKTIRDWLDIEANKPKGEVCAKMDRDNWEDEDPAVESFGQGSSSDSEDHNSPSETETTAAGRSSGVVILAGNPRKMYAEGTRPRSNNKRAREDDDASGAGERPRKSQKSEVLFYCCHCHQGPYAWSLYSNCVACDHAFCQRCDRRKHEASAEEDAIDYNLLSHLH